MTKSLAGQTQKTIGVSGGLRTGTVVSVNAVGAVMVSINGASNGPMACLASYQPRVGDDVSVLRQDSSWLVLGPATSSQGNASTSVWTPASLINNFTNRGAGFPIVSYRINSDGEIRVVGQALSGVTVTSGTVMFNLPVGFRPVTEIVGPGNANVSSLLLFSAGVDGGFRIFGTWTNTQIIEVNFSGPLNL